MSKLLNINTENPYFEIDTDKIFYMFYPHLLKATRNNVLCHNYAEDDKIASWKYTL